MSFNSTAGGLYTTLLLWLICKCVLAIVSYEIHSLVSNTECAKHFVSYIFKVAKPLEQHLSLEELMLSGQKGCIKQQSFGYMVLVIKAQGIVPSFNLMYTRVVAIITSILKCMKCI